MDGPGVLLGAMALSADQVQQVVQAFDIDWD